MVGREWSLVMAGRRVKEVAEGMSSRRLEIWTCLHGISVPNKRDSGFWEVGAVHSERQCLCINLDRCSIWRNLLVINNVPKDPLYERVEGWLTKISSPFGITWVERGSSKLKNENIEQSAAVITVINIWQSGNLEEGSYLCPNLKINKNKEERRERKEKFF